MIRLPRTALAAVGALVDCRLPAVIRARAHAHLEAFNEVRLPFPAASAAAGTNPGAVSARTQPAAPASGYPGPAAAAALAMINRSIAEAGRIASLCCWCYQPESDDPPCCAIGLDMRRRLGRSARQRKTSAATPLAAVDDPAGTPPPAGSPPSMDRPRPLADAEPAADPTILAIKEVLAVHEPESAGPRSKAVFCASADDLVGEYCGEFADMQDWLDHVAPLIAESVGARKPQSQK